MGELTDRVLNFVGESNFDSLPEDGVKRAVSAIADTIAVAFAGAETDVVLRLQRVYQRLDLLHGSHTLLGTAMHSNALDAAVFNGVAIHAMDYDDTIHPGPLHPSCHLFPGLLAGTQMTRTSGEEFITAFIVGIEIEAKLALGMNPGHYGHGWHATSSIGTLAAAMAMAKLLKLSRAEADTCLGNAASSASGLRANIGSMTKPLHAGSAARSALFAALLAQEGFSSSLGILDGELGYLAVFSELNVDTEERLGELGAHWEITTEHGLGLKPYPCCGEATAAVEAALVLHERGVSANEIKSIQVATNERAKMILAYNSPEDIEQARFSMQFCVAAPIVTGRADLAAFSDATLRHPEVDRLVGMVRHVVSSEHRSDRNFGAIVEVELRNGETLVETVPLAKGWAERFLTEAEQREKFLDCTDRATSGKGGELFDLLMRLPEFTDMEVLTSWLAKNVKSA